VGGYVTVYKQIGAFTPYLSWARINSLGTTVDWSRRLESTALPAFVPGAAQLNASMRIGADTLPVYRQTSVALGSSYAWSPRVKLKTEWMHTRAQQSQMIDVPTGEPLELRRNIDVFSASLAFVF
jgi:hypothetical protein